MQNMAFALDHVVIAVDDLDRAVADYQSLGFTVYPGGVHHGGVSHNALIVFEDASYFEIIAYREAAPANRWWHVLTTAGEGIVDFAVLPENTEKDLQAAGFGWTVCGSIGRSCAQPRPTCRSGAATSRRAICASPRAPFAITPTGSSAFRGCGFWSRTPRRALNVTGRSLVRMRSVWNRASPG